MIWMVVPLCMICNVSVMQFVIGAYQNGIVELEKERPFNRAPRPTLKCPGHGTIN